MNPICKSIQDVNFKEPGEAGVPSLHDGSKEKEQPTMALLRFQRRLNASYSYVARLAGKYSWETLHEAMGGYLAAEETGAEISDPKAYFIGILDNLKARQESRDAEKRIEKEKQDRTDAGPLKGEAGEIVDDLADNLGSVDD